MMTETLDPSQLSSSSQTNDVVLSVKGISKKFCRSLKRSLWYGVQDLAGELFGSDRERDALRKDEFWALKDISFELRRGECLGLIGRNGAGKTTLLKVLNQLILPDEGEIEIRGKIGGLIALGAGFDPILTGRENIYINGSVLGLSRKEIEAKFDEIVAFSELEDFIDSPVKGYSSGMQVRLGFAVAAVLIKPDILLLDEVLAVGDMGFTLKCFGKIDQLIPNCAVVFISHNMPQVSRISTDLILLEKGQPIYQGKNVSEGIDIYYSKLDHNPSFCIGNSAKIIDIFINNRPAFNKATPVSVRRLSNLEIHINLTLDKIYKNPEPFLVFYDVEQKGIAEYFYEEDDLLKNTDGLLQFKIMIPQIIFSKGLYSITVGLLDRKKGSIIMRAQSVAYFQVLAEKNVWSAFQLHGKLTQIE
ncbi:MAG: ABC transporter ATP-binding protein [Microcystaceae cyanobacterium]